MSEVVEATEFQLGCVDVKDVNGELWFCAKDVANAIEYSDISHWNRWLEEDDKLLLQNGGSGQSRNMTYISEPALYRVLIKTDVPKAKPFERWVTKEVIPSIRKTGVYTAVPTKSKEELAVADKEARSSIANIYLKLSEKYKGNKDYAQILDAYATKALEDKFVLPLPRLMDENYSATEVGRRLGISANKVGKIANRLGIKIDGKYGKWYVDKSPYSSKEVNTFRYTEHAVNLIEKEITR